MDLNEIWQEHKRFIVTVAAGLLVFFIADSMVVSLYRGDIDAQRRSALDSKRRLAGSSSDGLYTATDRELAEAENDVLRAGYGRMVEAVAFLPRPGFGLADAESSPKFLYQTAAEEVRGRLQDLASRSRAMLPDGLGIETVDTLNVDEIERHLHALDMLERVVTLALQAGVRRIKRIEIDLDPGFTSARGVGAVERTRVRVEAESTADAVVRWLGMAETPLPTTGEGGPGELVRRQPLPVADLELRRVSSKDDEVQSNVTFVVVRVHELEAQEDE